MSECILSCIADFRFDQYLYMKLYSFYADDNYHYVVLAVNGLHFVPTTHFVMLLLSAFCRCDFFDFQFIFEYYLCCQTEDHLKGN